MISLMKNGNSKLDHFFARQEQWKEEMLALRKICLKSGLDEEMKWGQPCYNYEGTNLLIIGGFKKFCTLSFFKGALLKDKEGILVFPGPNSQSAKIIKFTSVDEITDLEETILSYIHESVQLEKSGAKVAFKSANEFTVPEELIDYIKENKKLEKAFNSLTPGRQRSWLIHFSSAKQSQTRISRIEKAADRILAGKGANEK